MLLFDLQVLIERHLDTLSSPRSSNSTLLATLNALEKVLACAATDDAYKHTFLALQLTFQCNIASRLVPCMARFTRSLLLLTNGGSIPPSNQPEIQAISTNLYTVLCLLQGIALSHPESKQFLGKPHALHILLDLLLASRHLPPEKTQPSRPPLTSTIIDSMLCILVDAPASLRSFEEGDGLQAVVKILKRAGTPREVRMKCLEFLYFYLLDETSSPSEGSVGGEERTSGSPSKRSVSGPATPSSNSPFLTPKLSTPFAKKRIFTPPTPSHVKSPSTPSSKASSPSMTNLLILNRPVDFIPLSPKKPGRRRQDDDDDHFDDDVSETLAGEYDEGYDTGGSVVLTRTTEEKKELLGGFLGNVDALVEGVKKAGILGLG